MKYNETMSDAEINHAVATFRYPASSIEILADGGAYVEDCANGVDDVFYFCTDASDAWPVIVSSQISINHWLDEGWAADNCGANYVYHHRPLVAAMIVYLQMMEGKS